MDLDFESHHRRSNSYNRKDRKNGVVASFIATQPKLLQDLDLSVNQNNYSNSHKNNSLLFNNQDIHIETVLPKGNRIFLVILKI